MAPRPTAEMSRKKANAITRPVVASTAVAMPWRMPLFIAQKLLGPGVIAISSAIGANSRASLRVMTGS